MFISFIIWTDLNFIYFFCNCFYLFKYNLLSNLFYFVLTYIFIFNTFIIFYLNLLHFGRIPSFKHVELNYLTNNLSLFFLNIFYIFLIKKNNFIFVLLYFRFWKWGYNFPETLINKIWKEIIWYFVSIQKLTPLII